MELQNRMDHLQNCNNFKKVNVNFLNFKEVQHELLLTEQVSTSPKSWKGSITPTTISTNSSTSLRWHTGLRKTILIIRSWTVQWANSKIVKALCRAGLVNLKIVYYILFSVHWMCKVVFVLKFSLIFALTNKAYFSINETEK